MCDEIAEAAFRIRSAGIGDHPPRANYLTVEQAFVLNEACRVVREAFNDVSYGVFQVGSSLRQRDWRDVDVRCIVDPSEWESLFGSTDDAPILKFLNIAISGYLRERTGLSIDFQFQHADRANAEYPSGARGQHQRIALGHALSAFRPSPAPAVRSEAKSAPPRSAAEEGTQSPSLPEGAAQ